MLFSRWEWHKACVRGVFGGPWRMDLRLLTGGRLICYWDKELCIQGVPGPLGMLVRDAGSGEPFYMSPAIACHCCFLSCPFHFPSPACFSDLLTAFSWLLQPSGWAIKRPERIQSSCACPSSLCWLIFCFPSVFSFKESYVLLLCIRLESLCPSFILFHCFLYFVSLNNIFGLIYTTFHGH